MKSCTAPMLSLLSPLCAALLAAPAAAFNPQPDPPGFGMLGIVRGQAAALNVVLGDPPGDTDPPGPDRAACEVTLAFVDATGRTLMTSAGESLRQRYALQPGVAAGIWFESVQVLGFSRGRNLFRAILSYPADQRSVADCAGVRATLELLDAQGRTQVLYVPAGIEPPDPDIAPPEADRASR